MNTPTIVNDRTLILRQLLLLAVVLLFSACATTQSPQPSQARVAIQEEVGFTITEEARISNEVRLNYDEALRHIEQGDLVRGIEILQTVVEAAPELAAPRVDLGIAYHVAGDLDAAEKSLLRALEKNQSHPIAHNELGIVYRESGRFADARRSYEAALAVYPGYHYARRNLAILCDLYLADLDCALENYAAYMATVPGDDEVSMWIRDLQYRAGQGEQ